MVAKKGGDMKSKDRIKSDIVTNDFDGRGNSVSYTAARLQRDAPELFEKVRNGELSQTLPPSLLVSERSLFVVG